MIVVTGAKGIIGRAVVARLCARGTPVAAISRDVFDLSRSDADLSSLVAARPAGIIHLAAAVPHSVQYPDCEASAGLTRRIDATVRNAAAAWDCRVVYASTCSLYDKRTPDTKSESTPVSPRPDSPYLQAKHDGEVLLGVLRGAAILRVSAPIGPGLPDTVVAKRFFDIASAGHAIRVWGTGKREQNYVDVTDIADLMIRAVDSDADGIFNIAADAPTPMLELASTMVGVLHRGSFELVDRPDPLEGEYTRYSNERARALLGWRPTVSLEQSIRSMQPRP